MSDEAPRPRKRTQHNSTLPERRTQLPRSTKRLPRSPITKRRTVKRFAHLRDESYANWIRRRPCLLKLTGECRGIVEADHVKTRACAGADRQNLTPLCTWHHGRRHSMGARSFQKYYRVDLAATAIELDESYTDEECAF